MTGRLDAVLARKVGHVSRSAAGLIAPASISRNIAPEQGGAALHHGGDNVPISSHAGCLSTWRGWQRYHMGLRYWPNPLPSGHGWVDLAYTVGVCQHGYTLGGRGQGIRTAANGTNTGNLRYYAVVWLGGRRQTPTQAALDAMAHAVDELRQTGAGSRVVGHSDLTNTSCPHPTILGLARRLDRKPIPRPGSTPDPTPTGDSQMDIVGYTRLDGSEAVYAIMKGPNGTVLVLCSRAEMDAAQVTNGWDRWQNYVADTSKSVARAAGWSMVGPVR